MVWVDFISGLGQGCREESDCSRNSKYKCRRQLMPNEAPTLLSSKAVENREVPSCLGDVPCGEGSHATLVVFRA